MQDHPAYHQVIRGTPVKMLHDPKASSFAIPFVQTGSYPTRSGNALHPLIDGEPAFRRICEAIDAAQRSVWTTVTFMWAEFAMPDGRGSALDVLSRAALQGVDVRLICWRPDPETDALKANAFWGSKEHLSLLESSYPGVRVRWDRAQPGFCQHQKTWIIDAGAEGEVCFVGGINLNPHSMVEPGHRGEGHNHDLYIELAGPSAVDVHHNFVQRWNEASERHLLGGRWGLGSEVDLPFPTKVPKAKGDALVQIQRTIHRGRYRDDTASPRGAPFNISAGERSNFDQYCTAMAAAVRSIYLEHQQIDVPEIIDCLHKALRRGVKIVALLPAGADIPETVKALESVGSFTLAGIAGLGTDGQRKPVWVHSKLMVVDGEWGTVGSCNLHRHSLFGNAELNAAFSDQRTARALLSRLFQEHLDLDISAMDDLTAMRHFSAIAAENRTRLDAGDSTWQGLAFTLLP